MRRGTPSALIRRGPGGRPGKGQTRAYLDVRGEVDGWVAAGTRTRARQRHSPSTAEDARTRTTWRGRWKQASSEGIGREGGDGLRLAALYRALVEGIGRRPGSRGFVEPAGSTPWQRRRGQPSKRPSVRLVRRACRSGQARCGLSWLVSYLPKASPPPSRQVLAQGIVEEQLSAADRGLARFRGPPPRLGFPSSLRPQAAQSGLAGRTGFPAPAAETALRAPRVRRPPPPTPGPPVPCSLRAGTRPPGSVPAVLVG